jgi:hypothetical protein
LGSGFLTKTVSRGLAAVLRHPTNGETYVGELAGNSGALVISSTLNWAVVSAKQPAVDRAASAF